MLSVLLAAADASSAAPKLFFTSDEVLSPYVYVFFASFIVAFVFTPIMRMVASYYGIVDEPDMVRKMHSAPVAYLGGVAVFLAWMAGLAVSQFVHLHYDGMQSGPFYQEHVYIPICIVIGASVIVVMGLWDDIRGVRPAVKIGGQILAACFLLYQRVGIHCTKPLFAPLNPRLANWFGWPPVPNSVIVITSSALVLLAVVGCCNATNLMDGLDGLCGGVTAIIAAGFLFLAVIIARYGGLADLNRDALRVVLALALLGGVLGFVPYNFNPASIFMGDTGSMFLGYCCAVMIILAGEDTHPKWFLASMVMFALPVLDTMLAFARRWVNGRPLFSADRYHFHHQLVARGFSVKQTVIISYGLAVTFAVCGGVVVYMRTRYAVAFYLVLFGYLIVAAVKMGMVHEKSRVITRMPLDEQSASVAPMQLEPDSVIEIREPAPARSDLAATEAPSGTFNPQA